MNPRNQLCMLPNAWSSIHKNRAVQPNSSSVMLSQRLFFVPSKKSSTMRPTFRSTPDFVVGMPVCRANWRFAFVMPSNVFQLKPPLFTGQHLYQGYGLHVARDKHLNIWIPYTFPPVRGNCSKPKISSFTCALRLRDLVHMLFLSIIRQAGGMPSSRPALLYPISL